MSAFLHYKSIDIFHIKQDIIRLIYIYFLDISFTYILRNFLKKTNMLFDVFYYFYNLHYK